MKGKQVKKTGTCSFPVRELKEKGKDDANVPRFLIFLFLNFLYNSCLASEH